MADVELLGIKIRAAFASFETAAKYGLEFPSGTNLEARGWKEAQMDKETCPECRKKVERHELLHTSRPWCGWKSTFAKGETGKTAEEPIAIRKRKLKKVKLTP